MYSYPLFFAHKIVKQFASVSKFEIMCPKFKKFSLVSDKHGQKKKKKIIVLTLHATKTKQNLPDILSVFLFRNKV